MSVEYQNQIIQQTELQHSSVQDNNNTIFVPSSQLTASPLEDPYMFEGGEDCILNQEEICYYYYGDNHLTPEEQTLLTVDYNNNNNNNNSNELYPENSIITWSSELELHDHNYIMNGPPYLYNNNNNIIEGDNFDTYNPFVSQSSMYNDGNMLLTQPLSEVTQNVIENQQFHPYDWYDLSSFPDIQQQYIIENNPNPNPNHNIISSKITEHNHQCIPPSENYYTAWTDFQLLEA